MDARMSNMDVPESITSIVIGVLQMAHIAILTKLNPRSKRQITWALLAIGRISIASDGNALD